MRPPGPITGAYHRGFEQALRGHLPLVRVNPLNARRFAQATGKRAKTDKVDARMLARMGAALELVPDTPEAEDHHILNELQASRRALVKDKVRAQNQLQQQTQPLTRKQTKARLRQIETHIAQLDAQLHKQLQTSSERERALRQIQSIPGFGAVAAATILIACPQIGKLSKKSVASLAGLAPMTRQSGVWQGKARIWGGRKPLRDALFMPALAAIRFNPDMRAIYMRMTDAGKPPKVAITAVMRKMIILANALVRENREWEPNNA